MTSSSFGKSCLAVVSLLTLASCQVGYKIDVLAREGHLAFRFERNAPRINYLMVEEVSQLTRSVWKLETIQSNGPEIRELRYGEVPTGLKETAHAEKLRKGQLYRVTLFAVDGSGEQHFIISDTAIQKEGLTVLH